MSEDIRKDRRLVFDEIYLLEDLDVDEISLVEKGCVPDAYFPIKKSAEEADEGEGKESETEKAKSGYGYGGYGYGYGYGTAYVSVKAIRALFERAMKAAEGERRKKFEQLIKLFDELFNVKKTAGVEVLGKLDSVVASINSLAEQMAELISAMKARSGEGEQPAEKKTEDQKKGQEEKAEGKSESEADQGNEEEESEESGESEESEEGKEQPTSQEDEEFIALVSDARDLFENDKLTPEEAAILQESLEVLTQEG